MNASSAFVTPCKRSFHNARMKSELWQRLRAARRRAHLTQQDVADAFGISRVAVSQWEAPDPAKRTQPENDRFSVLAKLTGHPVAWLLDNDADPDVAPVSSLDATFTQASSPRQTGVRVRGTAVMDKGGFWTELVDDQEGNGYFDVATSDPGAYFVRIRGGDVPIALSGWYVLLMPSISPEAGMHVLVKLTDGRSTLREFLWHREGEYALQSGDGSRVVLSDNEVEYVHTVAGTMLPHQLKR